MFTLVFLIALGSGDAPRVEQHRIRFATAQECIVARDWWLEHPVAVPVGFERWRRVNVGPNCFDRNDNLVRSYSGAPVG